MKIEEKIKQLKANVNVLTLSATPIPRTYALTIFGDMDVSTIKERPKGRQKIKRNGLSTKRNGS